jgi:group I intron endonuclease
MQVYLVTNVLNGKMYVGRTAQSIERRWQKHLSNAKTGHPHRLYQAIRKYGPEAFIIEPLLQCDSLEQLNDMEKAWTIILGTYDYKSGYNMTLGGDGHACPCTEETRKKISRARKGQPCPQSTKDAVGLVHKGKPKPLAQRQRMSESWTDSRRSAQAEVARRVNAEENKRLSDYTCPTCAKEFRQVTRGVYGGHRKACLFWNTSNPQPGPESSG